MTEEKKIITQEKHPRRVAQGHKLATLMKKKKGRYIAWQRTVYRTTANTLFSTVFSTAASTEDSHHNTDAIYFLPKTASN